FEVNLPQTVQVKKGSCVTVPCSFDIRSEYNGNLNDTCEARWVFNPSLTPQLTETNPVTGILTRKNCTTTFNDMQPHHNKAYNFRLECKNDLKYTFTNKKVIFKVTDDFPSPTLTPSTLTVKEGESVSLTCSAPAPCLPHTPTLTWTPTMGDIHETIQENQDKTKFKTSVLNFTASQHHHGQKISCTAAYKKQDGSPDGSFTTSLIILDISQILHSSNCIKTSNQLNCSCETVGNPLPTTHWYLNGQPVDQSSQVVVTNEPLNGSHDRDLSTLLCFSSNSFGSTSKQ
uniref:Ig-like domain-containing protein n=1 Tax=Poecilia formosa TaxID=48698 RepID=A0A096MGV3_POEFO